MRWLRFEYEGQDQYGLLDGNEITPVAGSPFDNYETSDSRLPLASVKVLIPVMPRTFYAVGQNYLKHVMETAELLAGTCRWRRSRRTPVALAAVTR